MAQIQWSRLPDQGELAVAARHAAFYEARSGERPRQTRTAPQIEQAKKKRLIHQSNEFGAFPYDRLWRHLYVVLPSVAIC